MSWWDRIRRFFSRRGRLSSASAGRSIAGGRVSADNDQSWYGTPRIVMAPPDYESGWRLLDLDSKTLDTLSPAELLECLGNLSPDVSRALWDFLRFCNPGWECDAYVLGSDDETVDERAQAYLDQVIDRIDDRHGSFDVVLNRIFIGGFMRGAFAAEIVFDKKSRDVLDIATPDPGSMRFRNEDDPVLGKVWKIGQWQAGKWVNLDIPTVRYVPIDPYPGNPYGRSLAGPALFSALFLLGLLHDLRRVVAQQGYPRLDLAVDLEKLASAMPASVAADPVQFKEWVDDTIKEITDMYRALEPDDAYVHTSVVTVNRPVGAIDSSSLSAVDGLIGALDRRSVQALKTMPLLMGISEAVGETHANRQWEVHVQGIKALQHLVESMLERMLTLALQAQGIQADVEFRFSELRAAELLRDEQVVQLKTTNAKTAYDQGWMSQDEASEYVTGHKADTPEPRSAMLAKEIASMAGEQPEGKQPGGDNQLEDGEEQER